MGLRREGGTATDDGYALLYRAILNGEFQPNERHGRSIHKQVIYLLRRALSAWRDEVR